jgi:N-acetyl-alpha-D-glucosaminyl L-malate synthase BshA
VSAYLAKQILEPRKLPVVTTLHGTDITLVGADRSYFPITRFSIQQSDGVTAVSRFLKQATCDTFGVGDEIEVIYNFVNCDNYKPADNGIRAHFAGKGEKVLIHLSNFRPVKRPTDVVEIFERVCRRIPSVLLMVGDGPERSNAEYLARHYGIDKRVSFLGKRDNIEELMSCADVLLLPSDNESFGLVALEAMACEVPVVVSDVGGLPEVVTEGVDGYLVPPRHLDEMAERALDILGNETRRREMGKKARETARSRFCSSIIIPQYERYYEKILGS